MDIKVLYKFAVSLFSGSFLNEVIPVLILEQPHDFDLLFLSDSYKRSISLPQTHLHNTR